MVVLCDRTMVRPGLRPDLMASTCIGVNRTYKRNEEEEEDKGQGRR